MATGFSKWLEDLKKNVGTQVQRIQQNPVDWVNDVIAPDFGGQKRTFTGNAQQIAQNPQKTANWLNDVAAPDFGGQRRTFSQNYQDVSRAIGTPVMNNPIGRDYLVPFVTGASRIPAGIGSLISPSIGSWYNQTREAVTNNAQSTLNTPLGRINLPMLAGDIGADPTTYIPIARGLSTAGKAIRMGGLGATSGFLTPAENMQDRLTNTAFGSTAGLVPVAGKLAAPAARTSGRLVMKGGKFVFENAPDAARAVKRSLAPSADDIINQATKRIDDMGLRDQLRQELQSKWRRNLTGSRADMRRLSQDIGLPPETQRMSASELRSIFEHIYEGKELPKHVRAKLEKSVSQGGFASTDLLSGGLASKARVSKPQHDKAIKWVFNKADQAYTDTMDRFHPLSKLGKAAKNDRSIRNALTGYYGAGSKATYHVERELAPILQDVDVNQLRKLAIARRDAELAGRGIKGSNQSIDLGNVAPETQAALERLYAYQDNILKTYLVDTGIISQQNYQAMKSANQNYVPYRRVMDEVDQALGIQPATKGAGSVASQDVIKGIKGSDRAIEDPLESIIENTYKMVALGERNKVARSVADLANQVPGLVQRYEGKVGNRQDLISLYENGEVVRFQVPKEVAEAAKGLNEEALGIIGQVLSAPARVFRATATGANPEFLIPNTARDLQSAFVNYGVTPFDWARGLASFLRQDSLYDEFLQSGGLTSRISLDRPVLKRTVKELSGKGIQVDASPGGLWRAWERFGQAFEQPTRIATFNKVKKQALKRGDVDALTQAAYAAQEGTTNFARRGAKTAPINAVYAFVNARAQGVDKLVRSVKSDPKAGARLGVVALAPALSLYAYNRSFADYHDERVVPRFEKENNFIIMLPGEGPGGARYLKIPKGDVGRMANVVESMLEYADGKGGNIPETIGQTLKAFLPVDNVFDAIPTALQPIAEDVTNFNAFYGSEIVPKYKQDLPAEAQDRPSTQPLYRMIGQKTGTSPARLQNATQGYLTGFARMAEMASEPFIGDEYKTDKNKQGAPINETMIVRRFLGGPRQNEQEYAKSQQSRAEYLDRQISTVRNAIKRGEVSESSGMRQIQQLQKERDEVSQKTGGGVGSYASTLAELESQETIARLEKKFSQFSGSTSALGKSRAATQKETAIKAVYRAWLDGEITEAQAGDIFQKQNIDPTQAEYTYVRSINDDEVAPYVMEKLNAGESDLPTLIHEEILTANVAKKMAEQGLISWEQYEGLKGMINASPTRSRKASSGSGRKAKKISISIPKTRSQRVNWVSLSSGSRSPRVALPKFRDIRA